MTAEATAMQRWVLPVPVPASRGGSFRPHAGFGGFHGGSFQPHAGFGGFHNAAPTSDATIRSRGHVISGTQETLNSPITTSPAAIFARWRRPYVWSGSL
jgi:hypothetical protein